MKQGFERAQSAVLTQLCTGHVVLNACFSRINAIAWPNCPVCAEPETVDQTSCVAPNSVPSVLHINIKGTAPSAQSPLGVRLWGV
ncbi:hypothetical protein EXIGLDRAFT_724139 [Exidia glandulosa HHB12029]|uniref:Uncharacterized protein n=1 Tax=Exidia glandulosa HHB12029 TaxID=1314781 RepID=A0A165EJB0_EXIGL|nr:hypothetical protein EXIGLDRAFT_724139 [Exidia glandulosa HHB12029]